MRIGGLATVEDGRTRKTARSMDRGETKKKMESGNQGHQDECESKTRMQLIGREQNKMMMGRQERMKSGL